MNLCEMTFRSYLARLGGTVGAIALLLGCNRGDTAIDLNPSANKAAPLLPAAASGVERNNAAPSLVVAATTESSVSAGAGDSSLLERKPDVHFVPTPPEVVDKMLQLAKVKKQDLVYDLGCGDGRIVVAAATRYGARAIGYDIDPVRVREARENVVENQVEHLVTIEQADIFTLDLSPATVVTLYLLPELNVRLIPQLEKLRPGSRVVSHDFDIEGVRPEKHLTLTAPSDNQPHQIYLWKVPLKKQAPEE